MAVAPWVSCCRRSDDAALARPVKGMGLAMLGSAELAGGREEGKKKNG